MGHRCIRGITLLFLTLPAWAAGKAPPLNDNFSTPFTLVGNTAGTTGTNVQATFEPGEPAHAGNTAIHSVWWTWTAPTLGDVTIDTAGSAFDTVLGVYTGTSVSALTTVASDDDSGPAFTSSVTFTATAGTTYKIAVDGYGGATGAISLNLANVLITVAYGENFNAGATGWTFDPPVNGAAWAADATPATFPSGVSRSGLSLNFNNGTDYAGGASGGALSPLISLVGVTSPVLEFWCNYDTETRGTSHDRRTLQVWNSHLTTKLADWQLASVGYSFNPAGGIVGIGPGPCAEAYNDLETGTPVAAWHMHRVFLDPAWGSIRLRFVFWSVDDQRNTYAGWAIDDLVVRNHLAPAPTGWPDNAPDTILQDGDGNELDLCQRNANLLQWSWGCSNLGDAGVHMIIGNHPQSILHQSFMFFDPSHGHYHMSQYSDFSLWKSQAFGFQKIRRGPKRSFCLTDIDRIILTAPSVSPGCSGVYQAISYGWQDVYALGTTGQELDVTGLATGTDYYLVGVIDPLNRLRETSNTNQTDQIHFTLQAGNGQVALINPRSTPFDPNPSGPALSISSATQGLFQGVPAVHVFGTGFDTSLVPVVYDAGTAVIEAPYLTIISASEIWVNVPGGITTPASIDLLRARGDEASIRIGGGLPVPVAPPSDPVAGPLGVSPSGGLSASGGAGGPFAPGNLDFTLSNPGTAPISWSAAKIEGWLSISPAGGTLAPGGAILATVSINAGANALPPGTYADLVTFTNDTNGSGSTTRPVSLTVTGTAPQMRVTPGVALSSSGGAGGPFSASSFDYTVENTGAGSINWTASKTQSWVTLSSAGGTLAAGATATLTVSINSAANALPVGTHADTVTFTNTTNGDGNTTRSVSLRVTSAPVSVSISSPPSTASSSPLVVSGTASGAGLATITWSNATTGGSGTASGTTAWSASIPLVSGPNVITITVFDDSGNSASATFIVDATLTAFAPSGGGGGGGCGSTGLEGLSLLALLALLGHRSRSRS